MNKKILILSLILVIIILGLIYFSFALRKNINQPIPNIPIASISPSPQASNSAQNIFSSYPKNGDTEVAVNSIVRFSSNQTIDKNNLSISFNPPVDFKLDMAGNTVIVTPSQPLNKSTTYQVTLTQISDNSFYSITFTTSSQPSVSGNPAPDPASIKAGEDWLRQNQPDDYLSNHLPYSDSFFSASRGGFKSQPTGHYYFNVKLTGDQTAAKADFDNWLKSLGLTDNQIQNLEINYQ